jgi:hypothetical protein
LALRHSLFTGKKIKLRDKAEDEYKDKYNGPVVSVSDNGNTALLLGTAVLALGIASRRFATR